MLEQAIQDLTAAVIELTKEIQSTKVETDDQPAKATPTKAAKATTTKAAKPAPKEEEPEDDDLDLDDAPTNITENEVKTLAKEKIAAGADRAAIKKMVSKLGAESITDLDQEGRNKLHEQLKDL